MLFHNSLKDYFLYWLNNKCSSKRKSQMPELNNEANSELEAAPELNNESNSKLEAAPELNNESNSKLEAAPEPTNNESNSELNTTLEMIKKIQEQQKQFEDTLNEILERLNGTQDNPTGEELFNDRFFNTNGRVKGSSLL
jgi:hypothetical protein